MKINAYEDISGKKDGNLKTLMLGLQIHISLTASNATILSTILFRMFQTLNESLIMQSTHDHIHVQGIVCLAISIYCNVQKSKQCHGLNCVFIELLSLVDPSTQDDLPRTKLGGSISQFQCNRAVITIQTEVGLYLSCSPVIAPGLSQALGSCYPIYLIIPDITTFTSFLVAVIPFA